MRYHNFILTLWQDGEPQANAPPAWRYCLALDNLETVLSAAGFSFADIVRLNIFTLIDLRWRAAESTRPYLF